MELQVVELQLVRMNLLALVTCWALLIMYGRIEEHSRFGQNQRISFSMPDDFSRVTKVYELWSKCALHTLALNWIFRVL